MAPSPRRRPRRYAPLLLPIMRLLYEREAYLDALALTVPKRR